jgi:DNA-binding SARP family transcriptional activator/tetratricopeptide (TPR) repeat protein
VVSDLNLTAAGSPDHHRDVVRVRVLGGFTVDGITERDLGSRKGRMLLKVLVLARGRPVSADALAEVLWGDRQPSRPHEQVGVLVSRLRGVLGADRLLRTDAGYRLLIDWLDVEEIAALAAASADALAEGKVGAARAAADAALSLARGPVLPDEDGLWVEAERAAAEALVVRARALAIDAAIAAGDHGAAAALGEAVLAREPYDETALRALMRSHLAAGRPASALAAYSRVRTRLAEDLGVSPTADTEAVYELALNADQAAPAPAAGPAAAGGFVGRAAEVAVLDRALAEAAAGATPVVFVEGEAGIGKSTLVEHWAARARSHGAAVLRGRSDELGRDLPLQPVSDALAGYLRAAGVERAAAVLGLDADTLALLLGPLAGTAATVVADAETGLIALYGALVAAVTRCRDAGPVVLVLEDLHVAAPSTWAWLAFARHRSPGVLYILTSRRPAAGTLGAVTTIRLGPLSVDEVAEMVGPERATELHERSEGHPLLLAALAGAGGDLPTTVQDAVALRADALGPDVGVTLRVAAVLGMECDIDLIAQLRQQGAVDVLGHLELAAESGLLTERGAGFAFRHALVRDALDAGTGAVRRALLHRQAAHALSARPTSDPLRVAVHAREGRETRLAAQSYVTAAASAAARFDLDAAEEYLATALDLHETPAAYVARARLRMSRQSLAAAADDAARAVALDGGPAALEAAGWVAYYQRRYDDASAYAGRVLETSADPAVLASAHALAGRVHHGAGDLESALRHLTAPMDGAPPVVRGVADVWLSQLRNHQGRPDEALAALARPLVVPDALAHPWAPLHLRFNRVMALGQLGRAVEALAFVDDLAAVSERSGAVGARFAGPVLNVRGWLLRWTGRGAEGDEASQRAIDVTAHRDAMREAQYVGLLDLADGCLLRGDGAGAATLADRLAPMDGWTGTMAWHQRHRLGLLRARLALLDGRPDLAAALAGEVAADAGARGAGRYEALATAVLGVADPGVPVERLDRTVEAIGRCAVLDGWPLVAALGEVRRVDRWRAAADDLVATVVAASGPAADDVRRLARSVTSRPPARG